MVRKSALDAIELLDANMKKLQWEVREKAIHASTCLTDEVVDASEAEKGGATKRPKPDSSTPTTSEDCQGVKPKFCDRRTYAQVTSGTVRVAIVPLAYPDRKLEEDEVVLIKELITGRILDVVEGAKVPIFEGTYEEDGALIVNCAGKQTAEWLKSVTTELFVKGGGVQLRALGIDEAPRRHRVVVHVADPKITAKEALQLLDIQNEGLASDEWVIVRGSESRDAASSHFAALIGDGPLEALKALNFKPYCGLGQATIRVAGKRRKRQR